MNRAEKETFVANLSQGITESQVFALLSFSKLTVEDMTSFRLSLGRRNIRVKVLKNTLAKRAFEATPHKEVTKLLEGPILVAYSAGDPVATTKAIWEWADKENFNVEIKGGMALGQLMSVVQLKALSKLPGRNELLVSFLWALKSHPTRFLNAVGDIPRRLGYALGALKTKKENES